jgi:hypothetical protein
MQCTISCYSPSLSRWYPARQCVHAVGWDFVSPCRTGSGNTCQSHHPQPVSEIVRCTRDGCSPFLPHRGRCALSSHSKIARQRQTSATGWVHARNLKLISAPRFPNLPGNTSAMSCRVVLCRASTVGRKAPAKAVSVCSARPDPRFASWPLLAHSRTLTAAKPGAVSCRVVVGCWGI